MMFKEEFNKKDKRRLYWLIDLFVKSEISSKTFCDEFYYCFDLELDHSSLSMKELILFTELSDYGARFSDSKEDIRDNPGVYITEEQIKEKAVEIRIDLHDFFSKILRDPSEEEE